MNSARILGRGAEIFRPIKISHIQWRARAPGCGPRPAAPHKHKRGRARPAHLSSSVCVCCLLFIVVFALPCFGARRGDISRARWAPHNGPVGGGLRAPGQRWARADKANAGLMKKARASAPGLGRTGAPGHRGTRAPEHHNTRAPARRSQRLLAPPVFKCTKLMPHQRHSGEIYERARQRPRRRLSAREHARTKRTLTRAAGSQRPTTETMSTCPTHTHTQANQTPGRGNKSPAAPPARPEQVGGARGAADWMSLSGGGIWPTCPAACSRAHLINWRHNHLQRCGQAQLSPVGAPIGLRVRAQLSIWMRAHTTAARCCGPHSWASLSALNGRI